jgi:para-aminobenzoate synthetase/4-amino-4-deoxychorismate lyase
MNSQPMFYFAFENHPLLFQSPHEIITAHQIEEVLPAIAQIEQRVAEGWYAAGYLSYEAAPAFDSALCVHPHWQMPLLWFGIFREPQTQSLDPFTGNYTLSPWQADRTEEQYRNAINAVHNYIQRGETYQVNYAIRLKADFQGDDVAYFQRLMHAQQPAYGVYGNIGRYRILSASPELFFSFNREQVVTRPMKGTSKRGLTYAEDQLISQKLYRSIKERAENWMIVDLLRNDLSRISYPGSVKVPQSLTLEPYPTFWALTSTVTAQKQAHVGFKELLQALFPCGSITGAPKIRTMEIIAELEATSREVYCGTIGYLTPQGEGKFNVPIRTVWIDTDQQQATFGVGGGITWDSTAASEYQEVYQKAAYLEVVQPTFSLLESILLQEGEYDLLSYHLNRLRDSAAYFQFPCSIDSIRKQLDSFASTKPSGSWKVRLLLSAQGEVALEATPVSEFTTKPVVTWAQKPIHQQDRFLYHKTTHRQVYEQAKPVDADSFDVLLWNEKGECTEFTIGNLVVEIDGVKWTPPVSSGLLPGTFRQYLLERGEIAERIIKKEELDRATRIWLINSVRKWVEVDFQG